MPAHRASALTDLAREVVLTKAGLTSLIDRLEASITRAQSPHPTDRRAFRITLTTEGKRVFRAAARIHVDGIHERIGNHMSSEEARIVAEVFERISLRTYSPAEPSAPTLWRATRTLAESVT